MPDFGETLMKRTWTVNLLYVVFLVIAGILFFTGRVGWETIPLITLSHIEINIEL